MAVVEEAVEHGAGDGGTAVDDGCPLFKDFVSGQDDGGALVAGALMPWKGRLAPLGRSC